MIQARLIRGPLDDNLLVLPRLVPWYSLFLSGEELVYWYAGIEDLLHLYLYGAL